MSKKITRRQVLSSGTTAIGLLTGGFCRKTAHAWPPGPDGTIRRDINPGPTSIRLTTRMVRLKNEEPEETVKRIRESGYTSENTQPSQWNDSELAEIRAALKKYNVTVFEVGSYSNIMHPNKKRRQEIISKSSESSRMRKISAVQWLQPCRIAAIRNISSILIRITGLKNHGRYLSPVSGRFSGTRRG